MGKTARNGDGAVRRLIKNSEGHAQVPPKEPSFMDMYRKKLVKKEAIHEYIEIWNNDDTLKMPLNTFLGLTKRQYAEWAISNVLPGEEPRKLKW